MKKTLPLVLTILASTYGTTASADNSWYLGALYNAQQVSDFDRDFNSAGIIAGYQYNAYFALETRITKGISGYSSSYSVDIPDPSFIFSEDGYYKEDIDVQASLLVKASYPIFETLGVYALAGYSTTKLTTSGFYQQYDSDGNKMGNGSYGDTETNNGFSYGIGLNYQFNEKLSLFIDYQVLPDYDIYTSVTKSWESVAIGVNYSF